jgi:exoribonuclease R
MVDKFKMSKQCDQMNRKNRMAQMSSSASVQFNTYLYFKSLQGSKVEECFQKAIVMRITQGGIYVMVEKYGIEGLLVLNDTTSEESKEQFQLQARPEKDEATILTAKRSIFVKIFDRVNVQIKAEMVEFRRAVNLVFCPN